MQMTLFRGSFSTTKHKRLTISLLALLTLSFCAAAVRAQTVDPETRQKVDAAIPAKAPAKPKQPRRMLVFTLNVRDGKPYPGNHPKTVPVANYALEQMGKRTGAYEAVFSNDLNLWRWENLTKFDAICFNNAEGVPTEDPELRRSLLDFVRSGRGFVGFHGGGGASFVQYPRYDQFPEFGEMFGAYEDGGHPWREKDLVTIKVEDPSHPVVAAFGGKSFQIRDQIFQFRHGYSRERLRILLSVDTDKTDMDPKRRFLPERAADKDFGIAWVKRYGRGRVFYNALGHTPEVFQDPKLLQHFLAGIQYALGDLKADDTPSAKVKKR
jgi:type 1 glutamine amidotransferase